MAIPTITLNNGMKIPALGLGTTLSTLGEVHNVVGNAIDIGYRLLDCAWIYGNEKEIGNVLKEKINNGSVKREELFIVSKLWNTFHEEEKVIPACKESLNRLGLDFIDCYLMHYPCAQKYVAEFNPLNPLANCVDIEYDFVKTWKAMEECMRQGLVKSIGLSNFNTEQVKRILKHCTIKPVINQIEVSPFLNQKKVITCCRDMGIEIMAYAPFGSPEYRKWKNPNEPMLSLDDPRLKNIAEKYKKSGAQVILRYIYQLNTIPIPKSTNVQRLKDNINIFDFELTDEELSLIDKFNCGIRVYRSEEWKNNPEYPFKLVE